METRISRETKQDLNTIRMRAEVIIESCDYLDSLDWNNDAVAHPINLGTIIGACEDIGKCLRDLDEIINDFRPTGYAYELRKTKFGDYHIKLVDPEGKTLMSIPASVKRPGTIKSMEDVCRYSVNGLYEIHHDVVIGYSLRLRSPMGKLIGYGHRKSDIEQVALDIEAVTRYGHIAKLKDMTNDQPINQRTN